MSEDSVGERWIGRESRLEIAENRVELQGYQMYAVEKWFVGCLCANFGVC